MEDAWRVKLLIQVCLSMITQGGLFTPQSVKHGGTGWNLRLIPLYEQRGITGIATRQL